VGNSQLAVRFLSESHAITQLDWSVCPYLQVVSKTDWLIKALLVSLMGT